MTGTWEAALLDEVDRPVRSLPVRDLGIVSNTFADLLKLDSSVDLRQRAPNTVQSDVSIRGGTFGQTLVLLDGMRLNDVQSGHHNLDLPVPLEAIESVEILKGAGSTLYGSDAIGGVVHFVTRKPEATELRLRMAAGNQGVNQQRGILSWAGQRVTQQLSFSRDFSSGFRPNRDWRNLSLSSSTHLATRPGMTHVLLAHNDRPFGADQFYGNFNSWERTRGWYAAIRQQLGERTEASFAYRRHTDLFVLYRDRPQVFTNRHAVEGFQAAVRRHDRVAPNVKVHYGAEGYHDAIDSNNLGRHSRARGAGYVALDARALRRYSFNVGVREEYYGSGESQFSPTASAGIWLSQYVKLRAGVSRAFRLPTYTDLYYHDPANMGSPDLRPERAWSYEGGVDWNAGGRLRGDVTVFERRETDGIDYVRASANDIWRARNFQRLRFTGVETSTRVRAGAAQVFEFSYTGLRGAQTALSGMMSKYSFNYPVQTGIASWHGALPGGLVARTRIGAMERLGRDPYGVWDLYAAATRRRIQPFVQFTNLTNTRYEEIFGVAMPGRAIVGGIQVVFAAR